MPFPAGPKVTSVVPDALPTEGGRLLIQGVNLEYTSCTFRAPGRKFLPSISCTRNSPTELVLDIGPGLGKGYRLELANRTGSTFLFVRYKGAFPARLLLKICS